MKEPPKTLLNNIRAWGAHSFRVNAVHDRTQEAQPLRAELFSADQMERHGRTLADTHQLSQTFPRDQLLDRLSDNEAVLVECSRVLTATISSNHRLTPAGEWLLDNFYLIDEQIRTAKRHLPQGYSRELPRLSDGASSGLPRVYDIALENIAHGDGRVDPDSLSRFVTAYQTVTPLKLGELWAIPIMLRLALIENLRRIAARITADKIDQDLADTWATRMVEAAEQDPKSLILVIADMARSNPPMTTPFVAELVRRLQWQSAALGLPLSWIEQLLAESHLTIEQLVQIESQQQAADQVSIGNSIGSLRFLGSMDWEEFVENMSVVEQALIDDPAGAYSEMNFATRDRYRHVVEKIAKYAPYSEGEVAQLAVQLAQAGAEQHGSDDRTAHVGFYLIDAGLPQLEQTAQVRLPLLTQAHRLVCSLPLLSFVGGITLLTSLFTGGLLLQARAEGLQGWGLALLGILFVVGTSYLSVALVNWLATLLNTPYALPRMDFSEGIPAPSRTLVIVPTMLSSTPGIESMMEALEVRFLANRDAHLHFGLLTDFLDAPLETQPRDDALLQLAQAGIDHLNTKYPGEAGNIFFLFHRPRRWNPQAQVWMGYERKRGKLADLNALLRGGAKDAFALIVGDTTPLTDVKYVITLDTDTQLPRDAARQFVGTLAHPLNHAVYDPTKQRVTQGYGILQPRVSVSLSAPNLSRYARLYGGESGIDPYTRAVSDVYQDVFNEGSFIGKGIYDVDAFEQALNERLPENCILSHDLLEGCYARAGLLSDVQLYEEYPVRYSADVSRRHRWIRGDWQLLGWLLPSVPGFGKERNKNPLSWLSRWKIFDNLRRSLTAAALTLLLLLGWTVLPIAGFWTLAVLAILLIPSVSASLLSLVRKPADLLLRQHLSAELRAAEGHFSQAALTLICLPYEAYFSLDAIIRTVWRMGVSQQRLLEWNPSSETNRDSTYLVDAYLAMWIAPVIALVTALYLILVRPEAVLVAAPILLLWWLSPAIIWWVSEPLARRTSKLTPDQTVFLRKTARKTWAYFENLVGVQDNWLPPDNYQVYRDVGVAHRTSPTNMGMALLANLSAYDFGYLPLGGLIERTANTLRTMERLERYHGHFYNWYDTQSLQPLLPMYVSTVDSGNLGGHLLTLQPGLLALPDQPILAARWLEGLVDTFGVLLENTPGMTPHQLIPLQTALEAVINDRPVTLAAAKHCLEHLAALADGRESLARQAPTEDWGRTFAGQCRAHLDELRLLVPDGVGDDLEGIPTLRELLLIPASSRRAQERITALEQLALQVSELARMQYDFLYDKPRRLFAIGYNVTERHRDASYYDLLASEARLCNFVTIAQEQVPQESWFALGRLLITTDGEPTLLSWSGSMFEYLMPLLVMPTYTNTLIDQTYHAVVQRQIAYGKQRNVPWGTSESGYNTVDVHLNYQYRAFGVPGLGLKRGLAEDLVIAPYASALALMVDPEAACQNLQRLAADGVVGKFGFYEAVDYTPSRQRRGEARVVIQSFMAHHQGMSLLSLAYLLLDRPMQRRFAANPQFQATLLLLQERIPKATAFYTQAAEVAEVLLASSEPQIPIRVLTNPNTLIPEVQLLSNGRYHVMVTNAGGGYSRYKDLAVTRWREDSTRDHWGTFCYIRDVASGEFWSTAHQPTLAPADHYEAIFSEGRAEFRRRDHDFDTHIDIVVSPEDDIGLRRVRITNDSPLRRTIEVTSYTEVVLASPASDTLHPAFSKLFVQTEIVEPLQAILCTRRPRALDEHSPWLFHLLAVHEGESSGISYETDRAQFIGRGNTLAAPHAMTTADHLSNSVGAVLDPIVAIRHRITLEPEASVTLDMVMGIADTREASLQLVEKYRDRRLADRVFDLAWTHSQVVLRQLNASEAEAQLYGRLANSVIYSHALLRADASTLISNHRGQSGLWAHAISGDLPIVLLQIKDVDNIELVRQLVKAHAYWRLKGLTVDLVIWNEDREGYRQLLQEQIMGLIAWGVEAHVIDRPGGIFVRHADQISSEDRILIQSVARVIITDSKGSLTDQVNRRGLLDVRVPPFKPSRYPFPVPPAVGSLLPRDDLILFNGLGGFTADGREYVITPTNDQTTPAPWVNVLANPHFGTVISESGQAYTWGENAHEYRLTPWHNDPVSDLSGEALYLRDEDSGEFWSPTSLPCPGTGAYISRHGFGYSVFEHNENGIYSELTVFVALDASVKFSVLKVRNASGRTRQLSATGYVEWVLGDLTPKSAPYVITECTAPQGALFARNPYSMEFAERVAFFAVDDNNRTVTGDRAEFIGRNGSLRNPAALQRAYLSGKVGVALDPCAAIQVSFELAAGREREIVFKLGSGRDMHDAQALVQRFRGMAATLDALKQVQNYWVQTLSTVQVETPDPAVNMLANGWLLYQTLGCRLWGRSGYYQSGGAFGFRDQLQDVMALVHAEPHKVREHLLLCAGHQFAEGDVQHWWHPPSDRGVRTQCSDDYLWLPLVTCRYILTTGDMAVLDEQRGFLSGRAVNAGEDSYYDLPGHSADVASLYQHCVRAILHGLRFGEHGLPLMGSGDWNDGMNLVGIEGKGESIWLGFFLCEVLGQFAELAKQRNDIPFAERCQQERYQLRQNLERHGWDGAWYRRAYFDDGTPLGSSSNPECQIDSIAQSWSVLSGVGAPERTAQAMQSLNTHLVRRNHALVQLLDPPFNTSDLNPGYIRGYVPGVRENGGQYTHAAIWAAMAFARLGDSARAWELLGMINPINHATSPQTVATYKVEPYVIAADVYGVAPHTGRGGWTWYTGSASWMYRLITESLLGLRREGDSLRFEPCLPPEWTEFKMLYRYRETLYHIVITQLNAQECDNSVTLDSINQSNCIISLKNDCIEHYVEVKITSNY
ncbi:GH36-type glycosyl hydrolase domain-containing protein [Thiothrix unzii]|jgi:cellobiose phosphorylase|uniref:GH36-type glycosyl hydrolase domain-containing protein n=1 Tax=Thiothrix unzii TaxID=111769 RepID=UPI002A35935F|nr:glucoamylase family protein [Thiothrix unzii]MDX9989607.1 glucoamylase family protein [Thiothrix unzii]